ncbi:asparagine synthase-related protein, partial [Verrucomicrobiota bacterium]
SVLGVLHENTFLQDVALSELARQHGIYVLLEGQGADETLAGYESYYIYHIADIAKENIKLAHELYKDYLLKRGITNTNLESDFNTFIAKAAKNISQDGTRATLPETVSREVTNRHGTGYHHKTTETKLRSACFNDLTNVKVPRVLRFKDRCSMMNGVELRVPFLDHRLVELSLRIPPELLLSEGYTKVYLRKIMTGQLPEETCFHVKRQVQTPQREWLRGPLKPLIDETINSTSFSSRGIFNVNKVRRIYKDFQDNPEKYPNSFFAWQWLSIEQWFRIFIDKTNTTFETSAPEHPNIRRYAPTI